MRQRGWLVVSFRRSWCRPTWPECGGLWFRRLLGHRDRMASGQWTWIWVWGLGNVPAHKLGHQALALSDPHRLPSPRSVYEPQVSLPSFFWKKTTTMSETAFSSYFEWRELWGDRVSCASAALRPAQVASAWKGVQVVCPWGFGPRVTPASAPQTRSSRSGENRGGFLARFPLWTARSPRTVLQTTVLRGWALPATCALSLWDGERGGREEGAATH